ncbi:hypothetical protein [Metabacillus malikii]|uniref:Uncharacterized protein n=1 Tax=Metabacillus malikii TaxID=1504265 RepID=A0ABT9ZHQ8_9BACI|nr:hypothetical protein [Metabacillus malikii]MDQ0231821.1 hypothetical protein [Metabacillus malikii]
MNMKWKKTFMWGGLLTTMVFGIYFLLGAKPSLAMGPHGHGPRGIQPHRGFDGHHGIVPHVGSGFSWLGSILLLAIIITVIVLVAKWLRKKSQASAMQQFIDTSMMSSHKPVYNQNASMIDQWEKNLRNNKEND